MGEKLSYSEVAEMVKRVDKDGDNHIDFEEFKILMS